MRRGSIFNGTRSWLLYNVCFLALIHAKRVWFADSDSKLLNENFKNSLKEFWNPKKCVVLSWASFWMKLSIAPARVGLGITTYLSIKTLANSFQDGMPRVAYLKVSFSIILSGRLCLGRAVQKNKLFTAQTNFLNILLLSLFTWPLILAVLWLN